MKTINRFLKSHICVALPKIVLCSRSFLFHLQFSLLLRYLGQVHLLTIFLTNLLLLLFVTALLPLLPCQLLRPYCPLSLSITTPFLPPRLSLAVEGILISSYLLPPFCPFPIQLQSLLQRAFPRRGQPFHLRGQPTHLTSPAQCPRHLRMLHFCPVRHPCPHRLPFPFLR